MLEHVRLEGDLEPVTVIRVPHGLQAVREAFRVAPHDHQPTASGPGLRSLDFQELLALYQAQ